MTANKQASLPRRLGRLIAPLLVLAGAAGGSVLLMDNAPQAGRRPPPERQARLVEVVPAQQVSAPVEITAWGEVRPAQELVLRPQVSGRVETLAEELVPGGRLAAGAAVLRLEQLDYELQLQQAKSALTQAQAKLALEMGQQAVAEREYQLLDRPASAEEKRLMLRQPQLETAQAEVSAARAALAEARAALERTTVQAPFDALVLDRQVAPGSLVSASTDLATLVATDRWWVELAVPVSALSWIDVPRAPGERGSTVRLYNEAAWGPEQHREGRVTRLYGALEDQGRMARLLVEVDDPLSVTAEGADAPRLLLGSFLRAEIVGRQADEVVAIDPAWLHAGDTVWVMNQDDALAIRPVQITYRGKDRVLIGAGLEPGDRIVTTPINAVSEGMPLRTSTGERPEDLADAQ